MWESDYSMPDMSREENDWTFTNKYADQKSKCGDQAGFKHTNRRTAQKIRTINHRVTYEKTARYFETLIVKNAWQATSLREFIEKMAKLKGLRNELSVAQTPDLDLSQRLNEIATLQVHLGTVFTNVNASLIASTQIQIDETTIGNEKFVWQENFHKEAMNAAQQSLHARIIAVDLAKLSTGLELNDSKRLQTDEFRPRLNRIANEKIFSQQIARAKQQIKISTEMPKEQLSRKILKKQNIKLEEINSNLLVNSKLVKFLDSTPKFISSSELFSNFNSQPNERNLLKLGSLFIEEYKK